MTPETRTEAPVSNTPRSPEGGRSELDPRGSAPAEIERHDAAESDRNPIPQGSSLIKPIVLALAVVLCLGIVYFTPLRDYLHGTGLQRLRDWIRSQGVLAPVVFALGAAMAISLGVPRLVFATLGGILFGLLAGAALAELATIAGSLATFITARHLGRAYVEQVTAQRFPRLRHLLGAIGRHGIACNVLIRWAPVGNCFAVNLLMSLSPITLPIFVAGTTLGTLPETIIYALFGSAATSSSGSQMATRLLSGAMLLIALGLLVFLTSRSTLARRLLRTSAYSSAPSSSSQEE